MKKLICTAGILLLFSYSVTAQQTYVPDDNFEAYLEANSMGNGVANDNYVTTSNISSVTSLNVNNQNISDLTGIEDFPSLTTLVVSNNNLSNLDLSNKTSLTHLQIQDNPLTAINTSDLTNLIYLDLSRTNISSLDVSNNTVLQSLRLIRSTSLSSIDVSNNTALIVLHLAETTQITSVDLKNNSNLTALYLFRSNVESVDLRNGNNTSISAFLANDADHLTCIKVDDVAYSVANWTNIDDSSVFSENCNETYVPDDNFEAYLEANGMGNGVANDDYVTTTNINSVTTLTLGNSTNISDLTGIEDFTALQSLITLGNTFITSIDVSNNSSLQTLLLNGTSQLSSLNINGLTSLNNLTIGGTQLTSIDVSSNTGLTSLTINDAPLSSIDLSNNTNLQSFYFTDNTTLTDIDLSNNTLLVYLSGQNSAIQTLNLKNGNNGLISTLFLTEATNLLCVKVDNASYSTTNWTNIESQTFFSETCGVTNVPDDNFEAFLEANGMGNGIANDNNVYTDKINTVTSLDISNQNITDITGLEVFTALETFIANNNTISTVDFSTNTALKYINLNTNSISSLDVTSLTALETLIASSNSISSIDLTNNSALKLVGLSQTNLASIDLSSNPNLEEVYLVDINSMSTIDLKNGNNTNITNFSAILTGVDCINVDSHSYAIANWSANVVSSDTFSEHCNETYVPDDNFEAFLESNGMGNGIANDDYVTTAKISSVTSLDISSQSISDLTGLEAFTALENLSVANNSLTTINVSSNINLQILNVSQNAITSVDISALTGLTNLNVSQTSLNALNISSNTGLTNLNIANTSISSMELSNHTAITVFDAQNAALTFLNIKNGANTSITSFNITGNTNLSCVNVDNATYSTNNWAQKEAVTSYSEHCYETYVPDNNFEAYLEANGMGNGIANDDYVTTSNIASLTSLNVNNQNISDLTGIEDFPSLTTLVVSNNNLSNLDLSNKTSLTHLQIQDNPLTAINISDLTNLIYLDLSRTNISSLDVSNNTVLQSLRLIRNTAISSIDVSSNTALTTLHLAETTEITSVDLKNNTNLTAFYIFRSNIETIDLRNGNNTNITAFLGNEASNLTCFNVDDVAYSVTNWTFIDNSSVFSEHCNETYVPDDDFEAHLEANGMGNGIANDDYVNTAAIASQTSLWIQDSSVSDLTGVEAFINLETLVVRRCNLTSLDLSANTALTMLSFEDNQITSIDLSSNTELTQIITSNNALGTLDVSNLTKLTIIESINNGLSTLDISNNPLLTALRVGGNQLTSIDISSHTSLIQLSAPNNNLESLNAANGNNSNFNLFDITGNTNLACVLVDDPAYSTTNWTDIDAGVIFSDVNCDITYVPDDSFENYLETHDSNGSVVSVGDPASMGNGVANDNYVLTVNISSVTSLDISNQNISDLTGIEVFTALQSLIATNNSLSTIDLSSNTNLTTLNIGSNSSITGIDVSSNTALINLNIANTSITDLDLRNNTALIDFVANNGALQSLDLRNGNNTNINTFDVSGNSNLTCISVDNVDYATTNWSSYSGEYSLSCGETFVPDDNFEMYLETHNSIGQTVPMGDSNSLGNGSMDNFVTTSKIELVSNLDIRSNNIADLTGIEDFIFLLELNVTGNPITSLNLPSEVIYKELRLGGTSLTSLDVSDFTFLQILNISNTSISSIDLSSNTQLQQLDIGGTSISSIDLSNNILLEDLFMGNTSITSIDLSANTALRGLDLYEGSVTSLDLSNNTALTSLYAFNGSLQSLDLRNGNNTNLSYINVQSNFNLTCIQVDDAAYSNTNWTNIDAHTSFGEDGCGIEVSAKIMLQGPYNSGLSLMNDDLRSAGYLPTTSPYTDAITVDSNVFNTTGSNAIVDWVYVELRDKNDITNVLFATSALLQRDGDVVATDGTSPVFFEASSDNYYVAVSHRNHIAIATNAVVSLSGDSTTVDFTNNLTTIKGGISAVSEVNEGVYAMVAGDANANGNIQTTDINPIVQAIGVLGYNIHDINMNGAVQTTDTPIARNLIGKIKQF